MKLFLSVGFVTAMLSDCYRCNGEMVSTLDFESRDPSSNLGETSIG